MKRFRCGDVVPGCGWESTGSEEEILRAAAVHAAEGHGVPEMPPEFVERIRGAIVPA